MKLLTNVIQALQQKKEEDFSLNFYKMTGCQQKSVISVKLHVHRPIKWNFLHVSFFHILIWKRFSSDVVKNVDWIGRLWRFLSPYSKFHKIPWKSVYFTETFLMMELSRFLTLTSHGKLSKNLFIYCDHLILSKKTEKHIIILQFLPSPLPC